MGEQEYSYAYLRFKCLLAGVSSPQGLFTPNVSINVSDSVLIENNGVTPEWGCNPFSSNSIVFNENNIASVIRVVTVLMLMLGVNGPYALQ